MQKSHDDILGDLEDIIETTTRRPGQPPKVPTLLASFDPEVCARFEIMFDDPEFSPRRIAEIMSKLLKRMGRTETVSEGAVRAHMAHRNE
jgi:hypothetical protein